MVTYVQVDIHGNRRQLCPLFKSQRSSDNLYYAQQNGPNA
jgi:hypothetical protein